MIVINLTGGMGNQMFQYAFGKSLSLRSKVIMKTNFTDALFCTTRNYSLDCFEITSLPANTKEIKKSGFPTNKLGRIIYRISKTINLSALLYPKVISEININRITTQNKLDNIYLEGFWQKEKYFNKYKKEIQKEFSFRKKISKKNATLLKKINNTNSVAIHIRRGDYVTNPEVKKIFNVCGKDYYDKAINYITKNVNNPTFFIFSEDEIWAKENLQPKLRPIFIHSRTDWEDMYLISKCKYNIIANSSFSWWAAWLNRNKNKIILAPKNWTSRATSDELEIVPKKWVKIENIS